MTEILKKTTRFRTHSVRHFFLLCCLAVALGGSAQTNTSSPYSAYGIGEMNNNAFSANSAMAGTSLAFRQPLNINFANPASYSALQLTTFETALKTDFRKSWYGDSMHVSNSSTVSYISFGFPLTKKWGASFGLVPLSSSGYKVYYSDSSADLGKTDYQYTSSGGANQVYLGTGYNILKNLSIGMNASFLFGSIEKSNTVEYSTLSTVFNSRVIKSTSFSDFYPGIGLQFLSNPLKTIPSDSMNSVLKNIQKLKELRRSKADSMGIVKDSLGREIDKQKSEIGNIKEKHVAGNWKFTAGLVFNPPMKIRTRETLLAERYHYTGGFMVTEDTVLNSSDVKNTITLPPRIGIGFGFSNSESWLFGAEVTYQDWSAFTSGNGTEHLRNSILISAGAERIPQPKAAGSYFKKVRYRCGVRYAQTLLDINGTPIDEYGVTIGAGFPVRKAMSVINLSADLGMRGTTSNNLVKEMNARFILGLTLNDKWFVRRKFD